MRTKELIASYFISIDAAKKIIADGTIRHVAITRGASDKALKLLKSNGISRATISNYDHIPVISEGCQKSIDATIKHEQIAHAMGRRLAEIGFPCNLKKFHNKGFDLSIELEDFQVERFWSELANLKRKHSKE